MTPDEEFDERLAQAVKRELDRTFEARLADALAREGVITFCQACGGEGTTMFDSCYTCGGKGWIKRGDVTTW